jgi:hypothetical protein
VVAVTKIWMTYSSNSSDEVEAEEAFIMVVVDSNNSLNTKTSL